MKLTRGEGAPERGGCWMVAINWYATSGDVWSDKPECVDPFIRQLSIALNDVCEDGEREALIGPHIFDPLGTWNPKLARERLDVAFAAMWKIALAALSAGKDGDGMDMLWGLCRAAAGGGLDLNAFGRATNLRPGVAVHSSALVTVTRAIMARSVYPGMVSAPSHVAASIVAACEIPPGPERYTPLPMKTGYIKPESALTDIMPQNMGIYVPKNPAKQMLLDLILELCSMGEKKEIVSEKTKTETLTEVCKVQEKSWAQPAS